MNGLWNMLGIDLGTVDKAILIISFMVSVFTYTFWSPIKEWTGVPIFYVGTALSVVGYTFVLWRKYRNIVTEIILAGTTNALLDELFFDPTAFQINEYIMFCFIIVIILYNARKRGSA
jgi:hypothetical protein